MDLLAGLAAVVLVGIYLYSRKSRRPAQGPLAAPETPVSEIGPEGLRAAVESLARRPARSYQTELADGSAVAFGHTPGHDRLDVFASTPDGGYSCFEYSLASQKWLAEQFPDRDGEIRAVIKDTFPG